MKVLFPAISVLLPLPVPTTISASRYFRSPVCRSTQPNIFASMKHCQPISSIRS